jgi:hypothetical protein
MKKRISHTANCDEIKTSKILCECGHMRYEHEIYPDEYCYKCECKKFIKKKIK